MERRYRVAITDYVFPNLEEEHRVLSEIGAEVVSAQCRTEDEVIEVCRGADAVLVCYAPVTARVIDTLDRCRIIARYGIGVNNVDIGRATERKILVTNVPDYCVDEVSDHALGLLLALARKIPQLDRTVKGGLFDFKGWRPMFRLKGKVLGLMALGKIGQALTPKAQSLGLQVIAHDPFVPKDVAASLGVRLVSWDELLSASDFISIHSPLTPETRHAFSTEAFRKMKRTAYVINTARGEIIDEEALAQALETGQIAGAALDVLTDEKTVAKNKLLRFDSVIITPHAAFYSEESTIELQRKAAEQVLAALKGVRPKYLLNKEVWKA